MQLSAAYKMTQKLVTMLERVIKRPCHYDRHSQNSEAMKEDLLETVELAVI